MGELQQILYNGCQVKVGTFEAHPGHPRFHDTGPIGGHLIVIARVPVMITHRDAKPILANPNLVLCYNRGQEYRRDVISPQGDHCHWISFSDSILQDALLPVDRSVPDHLETPFLWSYGPSSPETYLKQRWLVESLFCHSAPDSLLIEETSFEILAKVVASCSQAWLDGPVRLKQRQQNQNAEIAQAILEILAVRFLEPLSLVQIADSLGYSPFHVSHLFHQHTGMSIHQYLCQLRLRTGVERILGGEEDLSRLAQDLGFAHHSHFSLAFRRAFGQPPAEVRKLFSMRNQKI